MIKNILVPEIYDVSEVSCPFFFKNSPPLPPSFFQREGDWGVSLAYLSDESRLKGQLPERIWFPSSTVETISAIQQIKKRNENVTLSGARTGIVGGAVPVGCKNLLSLERLIFTPQVRFNNNCKDWTITVGAGQTLKDLHTRLLSKDYKAEGSPCEGLVYPVDPTELSASIGGNVATNASGARTYYFGPTRNWVQGIVVVLINGELLRLQRGQYHAENNVFFIESEGVRHNIQLPKIVIPSTKHVAGYYIKENMDLIDLFIGSEGTLGIVTEIELRLTKSFPKNCLSIFIFFHVDRCADVVSEINKGRALSPLALEYMDERSLKLLSEYRKMAGDASGVPHFPEDSKAALYLEIGYDQEDDFDRVYNELENLLQKYGVSLESSWAGTTLMENEKMKRFRHALPERINSIIAGRKKHIPELTKIGTDMAVPGNSLNEMMEIYRSYLDAASLDYCIFGHIGNGHLHVNILPKSAEEMYNALNIYENLAKFAVALNGSVAAEHGIGRLKKKFLRIQYTDDDIENMKTIKSAFDPDFRLNPGVLF